MTELKCAKCGKTKEEHFNDPDPNVGYWWCYPIYVPEARPQFTPPDSPKNSESEWRELGPDEVIDGMTDCEFYVGLFSAPYHWMMGRKAGDFPLYKFRRRITQPDTGAKWSHFAADVLADDSFSKYWNGLDADARNGLLAILQRPSCRYGFGPEIKSQAAQAEPALPRKAHVSQEAEECKVGAAPSEIPLKEWLAVQDAYKEAYEKSRTPINEWTYRGSLVSADFILCRFGKTVAVVPDAAVVRELVDSLNNLQSLQAQLDAARAERDELNRKWFAATCDNGRVDKTPEAVEAFLDRIGTEEERERDELRQKLAEAEKAVLLSIQNYKEAIHERDRLHHDALGYLAKYTCTPEEGYLKAPQCLSQDIDRVGTERDSLRAQVETLKGALRPFAEAFDPKLAGWYFNMERLRSAKAAVDSGGGK